jgi:hypothetical protein
MTIRFAPARIRIRQGNRLGGAPDAGVLRVAQAVERAIFDREMPGLDVHVRARGRFEKIPSGRAPELDDVDLAAVPEAFDFADDRVFESRPPVPDIRSQ